jgi:hypothetical protein
LDSKDPFEGKFFRFLGEFTALFYDQHLLNRLVHFGSLHNNTDKPLENFRAKVNDYYQQVLHHIEAFLQQGKDSGYFKAELETSSLALFLLLSIEGYIYMSMLAERMPIEQVLIENVAKFISSLANTELPNNGKLGQAFQKKH